MSADRTRGRRTRAGSTRARKHADPPTTAQNFWQPLTQRFEYGKEAFRVHALRKGRPSVLLDPLMSELSWQRQGAQPRTGSLVFYHPLGRQESDLVAQSDQIAIDVSLHGRSGPWYRMLRMAVSNPQETIVAGITNLDLKTIAIDALTKSKTDWRFGKDSAHPHGWTARQITIAVCARMGAPVGRIAAASAFLPSIVDKNASAYDVILRAWRAERHSSGRRFVVDEDSGAVQVTEVGRPRYMLPLGPAIAEATLSTFDATSFASAINVRGHTVHTVSHTTVSPVKHKVHHYTRRKKSLLHVLVVDHDRVARYGYVEKTIQAPASIQTAAGLRQYGLRYLARQAKPTPTVEFTHPGIPWVDVGSAIELEIPQIRFRNLTYVQSVSHAVGAGQYTMDVTIGYRDPWLNQQSKIAGQKRTRGLKALTPGHFLTHSTHPHTGKAVVHSGGRHH